MKNPFFASFFALFITIQAFGWGATGHRAVGHIAWQYLTPAAKKQVAKLLKGESLAMSGTWMDDIKSDSTYDYMADWHWVTVETGKTYADSPKNPNGDVIATLERLISELKGKKLSGKKAEEALRIIVHLIGDIHQPLHVGCCDDAGGNRVRVKWFREDSNLHRVWDSDMVDYSKLSYTELATSLPKLPKTEVQRLQKAGVREWANESMGMRRKVYATGDNNLGYKYSYQNLPHVKRRILEAGIRLAGVLNSIYK